MRRIIWFTLEKDTFYLDHRFLGKKKTMGFPKISFAEKENLQMILCTFPEDYRKGNCFSKQQGWSTGVLLQLMQKCCVELAADTYYLSEEFGKGMLSEKNPLWTNGQRMCPEVWELVLGQIKGVDEIVYITASRELPDIPVSLLRKVKRFYRMCDGQTNDARTDAAQSELESYLWQQYGMPVMDVKDWKELDQDHLNGQREMDSEVDTKTNGNRTAERILIIDDWEKNPCQMRTKLAKRIYYVDMWSSAEKYAYINQLGSGNDREGIQPCAGVKYFSEYEMIRRFAESNGTV